MIFNNNSDLRALVRLGMAHDPAKQRELLSATSFILADVDFDAAVAEVKAQHPPLRDSDDLARARAAYRLLTKTKAPDSPVATRHSIFSRSFWSAPRVWSILRVAWAIAILATLILIAARPVHGQDGGVKQRLQQRPGARAQARVPVLLAAHREGLRIWWHN